MELTALTRIKKGFSVARHRFFAKQITPGRFKEEEDLDMHISIDDHETHLLYAKVFTGRKPHYRPWIELFGINTRVILGNETVEYIGSELERALLATFASALTAGENMFVDYQQDIETKRQLADGLPVVTSRLGTILFELGFTWFKDWYFPEGYMEGDQKLQAERPLDSASRSRYVKEICASVASFLDSAQNHAHDEIHYVRALQRAQALVHAC
jgi:hypothetical protein